MYVKANSSILGESITWKDFSWNWFL